VHKLWEYTFGLDVNSAMLRRLTDIGWRVAERMPKLIHPEFGNLPQCISFISSSLLQWFELQCQFSKPQIARTSP